jgi:hypothetical protein
MRNALAHMSKGQHTVVADDLLPGLSSLKERVCSGFGPSLTGCSIPAA